MWIKGTPLAPETPTYYWVITEDQGGYRSNPRLIKIAPNYQYDHVTNIQNIDGNLIWWLDSSNSTITPGPQPYSTMWVRNIVAYIEVEFPEEPDDTFYSS